MSDFSDEFLIVRAAARLEVSPYGFSIKHWLMELPKHGMYAGKGYFAGRKVEFGEVLSNDDVNNYIGDPDDNFDYNGYLHDLEYYAAEQNLIQKIDQDPFATTYTVRKAFSEFYQELVEADNRFIDRAETFLSDNLTDDLHAQDPYVTKYGLATRSNCGDTRLNSDAMVPQDANNAAGASRARRQADRRRRRRCCPTRHGSSWSASISASTDGTSAWCRACR